MKIRTIRYYLREGFKGLFRNHLMTVASLATICACIFIIILSYVIAVNLDYSLERLEQTVGISVFLEDNLSEEDLEAINSEISNLSNVLSVVYVSPKEALEKLKDDLNEYRDILDGFENDNPLSDSFEIKIIDPTLQAQLIEDLKQVSGIRKVQHAQEATDILISINDSIRIISLVIILILGIISVVIIMNTVKLAVYIRRSEINIMKYVGATDWFIRWPFVIEGILIGALGASLAFLISWLSYDKVIEQIYLRFGLIMELIQFKPATELFHDLLPVTISVGVLLGAIGSVISVRKHLNV